MQRELEVQTALRGRPPERSLGLLEPIADGVVMDPQTGSGGAEVAVGVEEGFERSAQAARVRGLGSERPKLGGDEGPAGAGLTAAEGGQLDVFVSGDRCRRAAGLPGDAQRLQGLAVAAAEAVEPQGRAALADEGRRSRRGQLSRIVRWRPAPGGVDVDAYDEWSSSRQRAGQLAAGGLERDVVVAFVAAQDEGDVPAAKVVREAPAHGVDVKVGLAQRASHVRGARERPFPRQSFGLVAILGREPLDDTLQPA